MPRLPFALIGILLATGLSFADPPDLPDGTAKAVKQMAAFRYPKGLQVELFAAEPMLASPVSFCIDEKGRVFVAEEYRFNQGTEENRTRAFFLQDDLQIQNLDDRLAMYKKWSNKFPGGMEWFSKHADQVRMLEDRSGSGHATHSTVFAGGFNAPLDGLAAGVIARDGDVYLTCIPHLWLLRDTKNVGKADVRTPLLRGFGVNCGFLGHDLHGLCWGPDGKLYFSVGDRGFHVTTKEGQTLHGPRTGGVFRCDPDGSNLEVIFRGLRNPQELAFDQFGNLFADDNNCDKGDHSRLVYIVEDGDSGWNMSYQSIPEPYLTGPWHAEGMWHLPHKGQPAWIVPPVAPLGAGPSGFCFTSGLSLPERYRNRFFYCNYTGNGGVESFGVVPKGAGFEIVDHHDFLKPIRATDVDFGYDGKMYVTDFVDLLWDGGSAGGRIYTVFDPQRLNDPTVREVKRLFFDGFKQRSEKELADLLGHADMRVRQRAQFALAERGEKSAKIFQKTLEMNGDRFARLHAIWGLGQIGRTSPEGLRKLLPYLTDADPEIRAQICRVLGDDKCNEAAPKIAELVSDPSPRVRFFAAMAVGKLKYQPAIEAIFAMLKANNDEDRFIRHAGVTALTRIGDREATQARAADPANAVRMAVLLAQRRWGDRRIMQFLNDAELGIIAEAARAIHDLPLEEEYPALAKCLERFATHPSPDAVPLLRRALDTHFRLGRAEDAAALAKFAANEAAPAVLRSEAIAALADWETPSPRDRVTGFWRPLPKRDPDVVQKALDESISAILSKTSGKLQTDAVSLVAKYKIKTDDATFFEWLSDGKRDPSTRLAALRLLAGRKFAKLDEAFAIALKDPDARVRAEGRTLLAAIKPAEALKLLEQTLADPKAHSIEKQLAIAALPKIDGAGKLLDAWAEKLGHGEVPPELLLDVLETLRMSPVGKRKQALQQWEAKLSPADPLAKFRPATAGGDAERGRALFVGHPAAQCIRCHKIGGSGGDAGPDLSQVAKRYPEKTREFFLESLVLPSAKVAPGYGTVTLTLNNGKLIAGTIKAEDAKAITILTPENRTVVIAVADVDERTKPTSAMPPMDRVLGVREMRDIIEYLMTLK